MPVLVEAISVIIRADRLSDVLDWQEFIAMVPNKTLCADGELVRVGFMHPDDVKDFVEQLEAFGLAYMTDGAAQDIAVVDQQRGPVVPTPWIEFGRSEVGGEKVSAARLKDGRAKELMTPDGWAFKGSLSDSFGFVPLKHTGSLEIEESSDNVNRATSGLFEKFMFFGRTKRR